MSYFSKIQYLLSPKEIQRAWMLLILMVVGMLFETLGISLVIPAVSFMMQTDIAAKYPKISVIINLLDIRSQTKLITFAMLGLATAYLFKNLFLAILVWKQTQLAYDAQTTLSQRLFTAYLHQPYKFHLQYNSAQLVRNVIGEVNLFTGVLISILVLLTETLIILGISILLLVVEPVGALIIMTVVGVVAWGFYYVTSNRVSQWGIERQIHDGLSMQHLQQGLGGAKDVKIRGCEDYFLTQFHTHNIKSALTCKLQTTLQNFPRLIFELLAVFGLVILILSMLAQGRDMQNIIPALGLFAASAFRLMPSINRVLGSLQVLRFSLPVVNTLYEEFNRTSPVSWYRQTSHACSFNRELRLIDVTYYYPSANSPALDNISLVVQKGESIGLIGTSGSGKTTLVDVILGLLTPKAGRVEIDGQNIQLELRKWQDQIGYVAQSIYLTDDTLKRNVAFGVPNEEIDEVAMWRAIKAAQLQDFVSTLPEGIETVVGERGIRLSGGQRQRIGIARALYHDPVVLVLDEATSSLDVTTELDIMESVNALQGHKTIIIVAHRLSTIASCNRIFRLESGKIIDEGSPTEILFIQKN